jgi:nicotinamidase-related amidase
MKKIFGKIVFDKLEEQVDPEHAAILVIDMQNDFCTKGGVFHQNGKDLSLIQQMIPRLQNFIEKAREYKTLLIFIKNVTLGNGLSDSPAWLYYKNRLISGGEYTLKNTWGCEFIDGIKPSAGDVVVEKHRSSAFINTDLDLILRSNKIETIVVTGVITQGCVESTVRDGAFFDYYVVTVGDCVATYDQEIHNSAMKMLEYRSTLVKSERLIEILGK